MSQSPDPYAPDGYDAFIKVAEDDKESSFVEIPKEEDGSVLLSTLKGLFPNAAGLRYKSSSGGWRGIRISDDVLDAPSGGWGDTMYHITVKKTGEAIKRKGPERTKDDRGAKSAKSDQESKAERELLQDIIVLGLPFKCGDDDLKEYFTKECGELAYSEVKYDRETKKARGFGFIRFKTVEGAKLALNNEHCIMGRTVEVKLSKKKEIPMKLFVGRIPNGTKQEDLKKYFSDFGEISDVYIPTPFRGFGFITFASSEEGRLALRRDHNIKGTRLNLEEPKEDRTERRDRNERSLPSLDRRNDINNYLRPRSPRDSRDSRGPRDFRDPVERNQRERSPRDRNPPREREIRDRGLRERDTRDNRSIRDIRDVPPLRETRDLGDARGIRERDVRERVMRGREVREAIPRERALKERDHREIRSPRVVRDVRDQRDTSRIQRDLVDQPRAPLDIPAYTDSRVSREFNSHPRGYSPDYRETRVSRDLSDQQRRDPSAAADYRQSMISRDLDQRMHLSNQSQHDPRQSLQDMQHMQMMQQRGPVSHEVASNLKSMIYQFLGTGN